MRTIGKSELEDIANGAALLGSGGGGDPYVGKLMALGAIEDCGDITMLDPSEVADDALVVPIAMMGAPTVLLEKGIGLHEYQILFDTVSSFYGKPIDAIMPIEAGGVNSMLPFVAAARLGLPIVDVDGMGRAFPELQMVSFTMAGESATPMALVDEKGNSVIFNTISNHWTEELARACTMSMGGCVSVSLYAVSGKTLKEHGVHNIVTRSQKIGEAIRTIRQTSQQPEADFLTHIEGIKLFTGKITDVVRETKEGFDLGNAHLDGIGSYKGSKAVVTFQNENVACTVDGVIRATTPDLICILDTETFMPVNTEALKYGKRVLVVGLPCWERWRSPEGLALVGPRYFGIDTDYVPVEQRAEG